MSQKKHTAQNASEKSKGTDSSTYPAAAVAFFVIGLALFAGESTRIAGLPFFVLGITFFAIGRQKSTR